MELQILISARVPSPAAQLLSNHYYETRQEYYLDKTKASDLRRRDLIEDLSRIEPEAISYQQLSLISPRVAKNYANKTLRTLIRDIEELYRMRLLQYDKGLIRARKEEILAFLPTQASLERELDKSSTKRRRARRIGAVRAT